MSEILNFHLFVLFVGSRPNDQPFLNEAPDDFGGFK